MKLLRHEDNDLVRLLMRQDKTLKIRANHIGVRISQSSIGSPERCLQCCPTTLGLLIESKAWLLIEALSELSGCDCKRAKALSQIATGHFASSARWSSALIVADLVSLIVLTNIDGVAVCLRSLRRLLDRVLGTVMPKTNLQEHSGNEKSVVWSAVDFDGEKQTPEMFCVRFASADRAQHFIGDHAKAMSHNEKVPPTVALENPDSSMQTAHLCKA